MQLARLDSRRCLVRGLEPIGCGCLGGHGDRSRAAPALPAARSPAFPFPQPAEDRRPATPPASWRDGGGSLLASVAPSESVTFTRASLLSTAPGVVERHRDGIRAARASGGRSALPSVRSCGAAHSTTVSRRPTTVPAPVPFSGGFTISTATRVFPAFGSCCTSRTAASPLASVNASASFPLVPD